MCISVVWIMGVWHRGKLWDLLLCLYIIRVLSPMHNDEYTDPSSHLQHILQRGRHDRNRMFGMQ